ncbi:hypothetical protein KR054_000252, partial [Drosophila jambulina]
PPNVSNTSDTLEGLEDLANEMNDQGLPFILVDSAACTTRSALDLALKKVEQKGWEWVLNDIDSSDLPQLEDTEPPPELDMDINLSKKVLAERRNEEQKRKFEKDISELTLWPPEDDDICATPTTMRDNINTNTNIEEIVVKLNKLRDTETPIDKLNGRPGIQRQGTFVIKRKDEVEKDSGSDSGTAKKPPIKPSYKGGIPSLISHPAKSLKNEHVTQKAKQLVNQIGDLFVELSSLYHQKDNSALSEGTFLVTISPVDGTSNCSIQQITDPKFKHLCLTKNLSTSNTKTEPNRNSPSSSPFKLASPVSYSEERARSQFLHKTPSSILNIPSPAKYYQSRKRY